MKRMFINLLVYLLISSYQLKSQTLYSVDKWMEYIEEMASETEDEERIEALYTDLSYLTEHPFELNTVTEGQLKRLPFLSDLQIRELLEYRSRYGKMLTLYELKNVEAFDLETISLLVPFIYISEIIVDKRPITVKNLLKRGSNNLQIRYDRCFQQKKGFVHIPIVYYNNIRIGSIWESRSIILSVIRMNLMNVSNSVWLQKKMQENLSGMNIIKGMTIIRCIFFSKK